MTRMTFITTALIAHAGCGSGMVCAADFGSSSGGTGTNDLTKDTRTHSAFDEITFGAPKAPQATRDIDGRSSGATTVLTTTLKTMTPADAIGMGTGQVKEDMRTHRAADGRDMGAHQTTQQRVHAAAGEFGVPGTACASKQRSRQGGSVVQKTTRAQAASMSFGGQISGGTSAGAQQHFMQQAS